MNKKTLAILTSFIFLALVVIFFVRRGDSLLQNERFGHFRAKPTEVRETPKPLEETTEVAQVEEENSFLPRKDAPDEAAVKFDDAPLRLIEEEIARRKEECTVILETTLPNDGIVDPDHSIYLSSDEELIGITMDVMGSFVSVPSQEAYQWIYERVVLSDAPYDPLNLKERLDAAEICYHPRGLTYLQVLLEAAARQEWSDQKRMTHGMFILRVLYEDIIAFPSSTNLVFAVSALKNLAESRFAILDDMSEVDNLMSRIVDQYGRVNDEMHRIDTEKSEATQAFRDYLEENELLRQQVRDVLTVVLERY